METKRKIDDINDSTKKLKTEEGSKDFDDHLTTANWARPTPLPLHPSKDEFGSYPSFDSKL
jgi:hypothetical protein